MGAGKNKVVEKIFFFGIFCFFVLFFTRVHPILISDTDDWYYVYLTRHAIPIPHSWNPARIFAETIMPLVSIVSCKIFGIFSSDFSFYDFQISGY